MDDQDRTADLEGTGVEDENAAAMNPSDEAAPVPTRLRETLDQAMQRAREELTHGRDVVREYEERYHGSRSRLQAADDDGVYGTPMPSKAKRYMPAEVDQNERKWAALAHASTLLTALVGLSTGGAGVLLTMFVPFAIYLAFRKRSEYVAFHALQAFTIQLIGTVGWLTLLVVGSVVWVALMILAALLILVLVGILLLPLVVVAYVLFVLASLALPLGMVIYSVIAAVETWNGHSYRFPYIASWVEGQMMQGSTR